MYIFTKKVSPLLQIVNGHRIAHSLCQTPFYVEGLTDVFPPLRTAATLVLATAVVLCTALDPVTADDVVSVT